MKILITGNHDSNYNRTKILLTGLQQISGIQITNYPINKEFTKKKFKQLATETDIVYLPAFTHNNVPYIRNLTKKPIVFDPLISKYMTKVFDYKQVWRYSPRALKNYFKDSRAFKRSNLLFSDTRAHKKYLMDTFGIAPSHIEVLYIGVDTAEFYPLAKNSVDNDIFNVGFYGGFIPLQGVKQIIETAKILQSEKNIKFTLDGNGFEYNEVKSLALKYNLTNIEFKGWIPYTNLNEEINKFDICLGIFGNTIKTNVVIPNKIYHYAAAQKCIITKNTPAITEIFTNNLNIVLSNGTPSDIAEKIIYLKNNKAIAAAIAAKGRSLISENYNAVCIAEQFIKVITNELL